ncbi:unnamed protein product [Urochloa humidicola]
MNRTHQINGFHELMERKISVAVLQCTETHSACLPARLQRYYLIHRRNVKKINLEAKQKSIT